MKIYEYDRKKYLFGVILPDILIGCIFIWSISNILLIETNILSVFLALCTMFFLIKNIGALGQPCRILIKGDEISFHAYGRRHCYNLKQVTFLRIKEIVFGRNIYLRIGEPKKLSGKYWLKIKNFKDGKEIYQRLKELELELNPNAFKI